MTNESLNRATKITCAVPSTVVANDPLLLGSMAAVAENSYNSATGNAPLVFEGAFLLSVTAKTSLSPSTGSAVKPGDKIYADTDGTLDTGTNVTRGFTLDKNSSGTLFGFALDAITSAQTATIRVRLKVGA